jgi:hypothetical protein
MTSVIAMSGALEGYKSQGYGGRWSPTIPVKGSETSLSFDGNVIVLPLGTASVGFLKRMCGDVYCEMALGGKTVAACADTAPDALRAAIAKATGVA